MAAIAWEAKRGIGNIPGGGFVVTCGYCDRRSTCIFHGDDEVVAAGASVRNTKKIWCGFCTWYEKKGTGHPPAEVACHWTAEPMPSHVEQLPRFQPGAAPTAVAAASSAMGPAASAVPLPMAADPLLLVLQRLDEMNARLAAMEAAMGELMRRR